MTSTPSTPSASRARAAERRLTEGIAQAINDIIDDPGLTHALMQEREEALMHDPGDGESPVAKLQRMQQTTRGQQWLQSHPDASWDDIAQAPL